MLRVLLQPRSPLSAAKPSWAYSGWDRFPSFYFGASETGPQSPAELAFIARHAMVGWGWQQGNKVLGASGEAQGQQAAAALRSIAPVNHSGTTPDGCFVYRQSEGLFPYFQLMNFSRNATLLDAALVRDPVNHSRFCGNAGLLGFSNSTFVEYWAETVGGEITDEAQVDAVFLDGFDKLYSGATLSRQGCPGFTPAATAAELRRKIVATARQANVLNAKGRVQILSTYNYLAKAAAAVGAGAMNGVTEDDYARALAGKAWIRFQEVWMGHGPAQDTTQIENAVMETAAGIPFIARTDSSSRRGSSLIYPACAFLIAQGPYCYWGASTGWADQNWAWRSEFDWKVGKPRGPARRISEFRWTRRYAYANVSLDVKSAKCRLSFGNGTTIVR